MLNEGLYFLDFSFSALGVIVVGSQSLLADLECFPVIFQSLFVVLLRGIHVSHDIVVGCNVGSVLVEDRFANCQGRVPVVDGFESGGYS